MKYIWALITMLLILFSFFKKIVVAEAADKFRVILEYEEDNERMIYFDVSENNKLCISYENDQVYEYDFEGKFIRIIEYKSSGNVCAYYQNDNLVINDIRNDLHIVIDDNNLCLELFESNNTNSGFNIADDCGTNVTVTKNGYEYQYINCNWFSRVFKNKKSHLSVKTVNETIVIIEENRKLTNDLLPVIVITILLISLYFLKKYKKHKY